MQIPRHSVPLKDSQLESVLANEATNGIDEKVRWYNSLQFVLSFNGLIVFVVSILGLFIVTLSIVKQQLMDSEKKLLIQAGNSIVVDIGQITKSTETLTWAIADIAEKLPRDKALFKNVIASVIEQKGLEKLVAGGGIWPEAYQFDENFERHSFFWARDESSVLTFLDDYNSPNGKGYHHEEWYVPVKHIPRDGCYWSNSYSDPYSGVPMVTCSVPMKSEAGHFSGLATIDIKLTGLEALVSKVTESIEGYAYVVDRNNQFLSLPSNRLDGELVKHAEELSLDNGSSFSKYAEFYPGFAEIGNRLETINKKIIDDATNRYSQMQHLASQLMIDSYQISAKDSVLLAALLLNNSSGVMTEETNHFFNIENDHYFNEPAFVQVSVIPETYWKLVLVVPKSVYEGRIDNVVSQIFYYFIIAFLVIFVLGYWILGKLVIRPFDALISQLSMVNESPLDESANNEFGLVSKHINLKARQLVDINNRVIIAMDKRERADKLRRAADSRFKAIARTAPDAIISVDQNALIIDWNPAAIKIFKYQPDEIIGSSFKRLLLPGEGTTQLNEISLFSQGLIDSLPDTLIQVQALRSNGTIFTAEFSVTSWKTEKGCFFTMFMRDISDRIQVEYRLRHQALHDPLTQLPNRSLFNDRLSNALVHAKRNNSQVAVMIIDLDNFKIINDTSGHGTGDLLLQRVAQMLVDKKRATDTIARLGGDEFGVIQTNINDPGLAMLFAIRLKNAISDTITIEDNSFQVGCSIGITIFPNDSANVDNLMRNADMAMYQAKEEGRNSVRFFVEEMDREIQRRKSLTEDMSLAIQEDQFEIYLQPLIRLNNRSVVGAEALIRWNHPVNGVVSPGEFIPVAEQSNIICDIGRWVCKRVCQQIRQMDKLGLPKLTIAVNISAAQFKHENIFKTLKEIAAEEKVAPERIECEITESAVMDNIDRVIEIMHSLRGAGFKLSIDDFGTGYSSLSYLKRFPINKIKIDQSFIADIENDPDSASIAQAIINLGHSMELDVLAEGVETKGQQDWLVAHGCDLSQGYYQARPMPFTAFIEWLQNNC